MYRVMSFDTKINYYNNPGIDMGDEQMVVNSATMWPSIIFFVSEEVAEEQFTIIPSNPLTAESIITEIEYHCPQARSGKSQELTGYFIPIDKWREIRAALRAVPKVVINQETGKPDSCKVYDDYGRVIFDGLSRDAWLTIKAKEITTGDF